MAYICYIDEAGNTETLRSATHHAQPVIVIAGLFLNQAAILPLTKEFIQIKRNFYPKRLDVLPHDLEGLRVEIKGSDIRSEIRRHIAAGDRKSLRYRLRFIGGLLELLNKHQAKFVASVWIKAIGRIVKPDSVYTASVQHICRDFQHLLSSKNDQGFVIADFRSPAQNNIVAHAVATQKLKAAGDAYPGIFEAPTFGISHNHAALQLTDMLCSALLYPMAAYTYCRGYVKNCHVRDEDIKIKEKFASALSDLQYQYIKPVGKKQKSAGGVFVIDSIANRSARNLFTIPTPAKMGAQPIPASV